MSVRHTVPMATAVSRNGASDGGEESTSYDLEPLSGTLGAVLHGARLAPLDEGGLAGLLDALRAYRVLVVRGQNELDIASLAAFAQRLGELRPHPAYPLADPAVPGISRLAYDEANRSRVDSWHSDMTFLAAPPSATILHARELPGRGGDTLFACAKTAYEALSAPWRALVDGLEAEHSFAHGFRESLGEPGGWNRLRSAVDEHPPVVHPVVREHPETGARALFVNEVFTTRIVGMSPAESDAVLRFLFAHLQTPEWTCRVRWQLGDVVVWDNRVTLHRPVNDYWPAKRTMHRAVVM